MATYNEIVVLGFLIQRANRRNVHSTILVGKKLLFFNKFSYNPLEFGSRASGLPCGILGRLHHGILRSPCEVPSGCTFLTRVGSSANVFVEEGGGSPALSKLVGMCGQASFLY